MPSNTLHTYFTFSRGQSKALLVLMLLIAIVSISYIALPFYIQRNKKTISNELHEWMATVKFDTLNAIDYASKQDKIIPSKLTPFAFDPNILDEHGFRKLGLRDKLINTIIHYRNKGGKFYNKESLKRIYGLHDDEYKQLSSFIKIKEPQNFKTFHPKKPSIHVELNSADTTQLIALPGIGSKLSMNIIKYRNTLGGFYSIQQIKEVYGISTETFDLIKTSISVNTFKILALNLNEATYYELNAHPYLHGEIAKALVELRKAHNYKIESLNSIKEIALINDEIFRKIVPYLRVK